MELFDISTKRINIRQKISKAFFFTNEIGYANMNIIAERWKNDASNVNIKKHKNLLFSKYFIDRNSIDMAIACLNPLSVKEKYLKQINSKNERSISLPLLYINKEILIDTIAEIMTIINCGSLLISS